MITLSAPIEHPLGQGGNLLERKQIPLQELRAITRSRKRNKSGMAFRIMNDVTGIKFRANEQRTPINNRQNGQSPTNSPKRNLMPDTIRRKQQTLHSAWATHTLIEHLAGGAASFAALSNKRRIWRTRGANMADARGEHGAAGGICEGAPTKV